MSLRIHMEQPAEEYFWGSKKIPLLFSVGPPTDILPLGYEPEVINVLEHFAEPGDLAIDAGASIGFHTCVMSKLVGETGIVLAFEPQLASFQFLMHHVHNTNKMNNVLCIRQALWHEDVNNLKLYNHCDMGYSTFYEYFNTTSHEFVEGRMLDTLLVDEHPRILKIDCEGAEAEILLGARRHLTNGIDCIILEFNYQLLEKTGRDDKKIRSLMNSLGYDMFLINIGGDGIATNNCGFAPPILIDPDKKIELHNGFHINVLFSTKEKVSERWKMDVI
jgi:FkbM family methyltransferase